MTNPFITNGYAGAEYFCDREQETENIISLLNNGNNLAIISPRRLGKTDLLRHCFAQKEVQKNYYCFIIDIYSTRSVSDLVNKMGHDKGKPLCELMCSIATMRSLCLQARSGT